MDQTVLFLALAACAGVQALFLTNHHYFLRGTIFSAVSGGGCLLAMEALLPSGCASPRPLCWSAACSVSRAAFFCC